MKTDLRVAAATLLMLALASCAPSSMGYHAWNGEADEERYRFAQDRYACLLETRATGGETASLAARHVAARSKRAEIDEDMFEACMAARGWAFKY